MAKKRRKYLIHGAFRNKRDAERKEERLHDACIVKRRIRGKTRYVVLQEK